MWQNGTIYGKFFLSFTLQKMKKLFSLVLATSLLVLFGCTKSTPAPTDTTTLPADQQNVAEWQTYESKTEGFMIQYPGTWTFQEKAYGSAVMFFTPFLEWDQLKENVGIMKNILDKTYTLDEYYAMTKPELINLIPDFTEVSNENIIVNDIDAKKIIYKGVQSDTKLQREQVYLIKDTTVYIITYTASEATFNEFAQKVDEMIATLEIK